jgi:hypothetical protein
MGCHGEDSTVGKGRLPDIYPHLAFTHKKSSAEGRG